MSLFGLKVAKQFGEKLTSFKNQADAEIVLYQQRDERLHRFIELAKSSKTFLADFTPESLKRLEAWYFELWESSGFEELGITREKFEFCMTTYFGEVVVRNHLDAKWVVREFAFQSSKYEIGVQRGLLQMSSKFTDHYKQPNNKSRQNILKTYQKYFGTS